MTDIDWITLTVKQEAEAESYEGKLAVAWVIVNRMRVYGKSASQIVMSPNQFTCWSTRSPTRDRLDVTDDNLSIFRDSHKAACAAFYNLTDDPTHGALFYFNPNIVIPSWAANMIKVASIGHHDFFKETEAA